MKITRDDDYGGAVLNCAVRYALGRVSYMPGLVMDVIRPMLKDCSGKTLWCFEKDIMEWLSHRKDEKGTFGMDAYEKEWVEFLSAVRSEIEKRKDKED